MRRYAFTLIELIFAIVIISVVVISMPIMMKSNEDAIQANINQEALFAASAEIIQALSYPWDTHTIDSTNPNTYGKMVYVNTGDSSYFRRDSNNTLDANSSFRVGSIQEDNHRRFHYYTLPDANISTSNIINNGTGAKYALNDIGTQNIPFVNGFSSSTGYKQQYSMDLNVTYVPDTPTSPYIFPASGTTTYATASNMKLITVNIKDQSGNSITLLRTYSANIGEFDIAKRRF